MAEQGANLDDVRARFSATAELVAQHAEKQIELVREQLRSFVAPAGDERAIDTGTGAGTLALALAPLVGEVVGVDVVPELLERARDPSHTRTLPDIDLRHLFEANGLVLLRTQFQTHRRVLDSYLDLAGCQGEAREVARQLSPGGPEAYTAESGWYLLRKPA